MKKEFKIYNHTNKSSEICIPGDRTIVKLKVEIYTGDETGYVLLDNGMKIYFDADAAYCARSINFFDGSYSLTEPEEIEKWSEFEPEDNGDTFSYQRLRWADDILYNKPNPIIFAEEVLGNLLEVELKLEEDTSGNDSMRSAKFYVGAAMLLIKRALKEMKGEN